MIGCALAGAVAGVNLGAVTMLGYLWWRGRRDLRELLSLVDEQLAADARSEATSERPLSDG